MTKSQLKLIEEKDANSNVRVNRVNYELAVLQTLRSRVRCKDIWVTGARKYCDPDKDLPKDFESNKTAYYAELSQPQGAQEFITKLKANLDDWLTVLNSNIPKNKKVKFITKRKKAWIKVSPVIIQPDPQNIENLKQAVLMKWPISLLDVLKETELRLALTRDFVSVASKEIMDPEELQYKLLLCLFALGTNTGLKRISMNSNASYEDLRYIQRRFINKDNLRNAIIKIVNGNLEIRDKSLFGDVTISCASDSRKFESWDQNLMTEWHARYGGRGIMIYWHVDKKSLCVYSQLKTCASSEVIAMLTGITHHATKAVIKSNYVDSHGQSLIAFGFSHLLNFDLLPRFKAIGLQRLYLPSSDSGDKYKNLESVSTRSIDWSLITENYDQMIQCALALWLKTADPEALLKRFTANNLQHPVYQALQELGRVVKTIFLCRYLSSAELRQEIHEGLNVVERWNSVNDFIFYGKKSILSSNDLTSQELSVLALHLLQASLIYINTLMIQKVLESQEWRNRLTAEDKRALSPLIYLHISPYGSFKLDMQQRIVI